MHRAPRAAAAPSHLLGASLALTALVSCARSASSPPAPAPDVPPTMTADTGPAPDTARPSRLPAIPPVRGPLALRVVYPPAGSQVDVRDSSFIFGSTGTGDAALTVNGVPVPVAPNGAWLAWLAFPRDSAMPFELVARTATDSARLLHTVRRLDRAAPPAGALWLDSTALAPRGVIWARPDEYVTVTARASEGAHVQLRLPGGGVAALAPDRRGDDVPWGIRAFDRDTLNLRTPVRADRYVGVTRGRAVGPDPGSLLGAPAASLADTAVALVEAIRGADTVRARWPVRLALLDTLPLVVQFDDDTAGRGDTDSLTIGRAVQGGTYHWFFPTGTRALVTGRVNGDLRVRLAEGLEAWVPVADARPLPGGTPPPRASVGSVSLSPRDTSVVLRVPLSQRVPFAVHESERGVALTIYSARGDIDWMRYGRSADSLVRRLAWTQVRSDEVRLDLDLARPLWGYRTRWDGTDLLLEIRRPPVIDRSAPLRGRLIVVDPGHPPLGATGPTGFREADANLGVALVLQRLLEDAGARVIMTRVRDTSIDLLPRTKLAERVGAELLVSIHNNALPDGVNPFTNNGTSVYYNQPRSIPLARAVQRALVERLGLRDLGIGRGDLALVRPTWMPSILCEGLFMMVPEQEAALRSEEGQQRYARGVKEGLERYLRDLAQAP